MDATIVFQRVKHFLSDYLAPLLEDPNMLEALTAAEAFDAGKPLHAFGEFQRARAQHTDEDIRVWVQENFDLARAQAFSKLQEEDVERYERAQTLGLVPPIPTAILPEDALRNVSDALVEARKEMRARITTEDLPRLMKHHDLDWMVCPYVKPVAPPRVTPAPAKPTPETPKTAATETPQHILARVMVEGRTLRHHIREILQPEGSTVESIRQGLVEKFGDRKEFEFEALTRYLERNVAQKRGITCSEGLYRVMQRKRKSRQNATCVRIEEFLASRPGGAEQGEIIEYLKSLGITDGSFRGAIHRLVHVEAAVSMTGDFGSHVYHLNAQA